MIIISNPPYKYGSEITKAIIDSINYESFINLMPISNYRNYDLYKHIVASTALPINAFKDADVNVNVSILKKEASNISEEEAAVFGYREDLQRFYSGNLKREVPFKERLHMPHGPSAESLKAFLKGKGINNDTSFLFVSRAAFGGITKTTNSLGYKWNLSKELTTDNLNPVLIHSSKGDYYELACDWLIFGTPEECSNFTKWWYSGNLSNKLIRGLNSRGGSIMPAIPRVDWSRPWTDEQILRDYGYKPSEIKKILEN